MPDRALMHFVTAAAAAVFLGLCGCSETTSIWTINPDATGKVELTAYLPPMLELGHSGTTKIKDMNAAAKRTRNRIVAHSKGISVWRNVHTAIADDGRILFKGTAYFGDVSGVQIGDDAPVNVLRLNMNKLDDGTMELLLDCGKKGSAARSGDAAEKTDGAAAVKPPVEITAQTVKEAKVQYQALKPILVAVFSSMKTENIIKAPGKVVESRNFEQADDGTLRHTLDGDKILKDIDRLVSGDPEQWARLVWTTGNDEYISRSEAFEGRYGRALFGDRVPARAVIAPSSGMLFDYQAEVAEGVKEREAEKAREELARQAALDASGRRGYVDDDFFSVGGGAIASSREDSGTGTGWTADIGGWFGVGSWGNYFFQVEVSHVKYEDDPLHEDMTRMSMVGGSFTKHSYFGMGPAFSYGEGDIWAMGPQCSVGVGFFSGSVRLFIAATGYLWIGQRDDEFALDVGGDLRVELGFGF